MTIQIAVLRKTSLVSLSDAQRMTAACAAQLRMHAAQLWGRPCPEAHFVADDASLASDMYPICLFGSASEAWQAGYETETPTGHAYGAVLVSEILAAGGGMLTGDLSIATELSYELLSHFGDPGCAQYAEGPDGTDHAIEIAAPARGSSYLLHGVSVSDFVLPSWYDEAPAAGAMIDYMGKLTTPFSMTLGGHLLVRKGGQVMERYGAAYPGWRRVLRPWSRKVRRLRAA